MNSIGLCSIRKESKGTTKFRLLVLKVADHPFNANGKMVSGLPQVGGIHLVLHPFLRPNTGKDRFFPGLHFLLWARSQAGWLNEALMVRTHSNFGKFVMGTLD